MDCHYFSRTTSGDTAHVIEQNFAAYATENWRLKRIHTPYWAQPLPGTIAPHEKMRWWQLLQFLKTDVDNPESCFIVEGDVVFGPRSFSLLDTLLSSANGGTWDIIATGLSVSSAESILWLCEEKWGMGWERSGGAYSLAMPQFAEFSGLNAFILNGSAKQKLYDYLSSVKSFDLTLDQYLSNLIQYKNIEALLTFPYLTAQALSKLNYDHIMQQIYTVMRQFFFVDHDNSQPLPVIVLPNKDVDPETVFVSNLLGLLLAGKE